MHAKDRFDDVIKRLEACQAELERQDHAWASAKAVLAEAGEVRFAFESLPETTVQSSLTPTYGIRA